MFTQKITMDCTYQQFHDILEPELLRMGYDIASTSHWNRPENCFITNNYLDYPVIGNIHQSQKGAKGKYLGQFNPDLFLALAAMTDSAEGNYGEYWVALKNLYGDFTKGRLYKQINKINNWGAFISNSGGPSGDCPDNLTSFRKATKEEIMAIFGQPKNEPANLDNLLNSSEKLISEAFSEPLLKDLLTEEDEKLAIEFLKSKNYKILKKEEKWIEV